MAKMMRIKGKINIPSSGLAITRHAASIWWLFIVYSWSDVGNFVAENETENESLGIEFGNNCWPIAFEWYDLGIFICKSKGHNMII